MTISIKPTASGSTIEQDGSAILTVDGSGNLSTTNNLTVGGSISGDGSSLTGIATGAGTLEAWVNFNGQGTIAIRASGNVSSITDNGLSNYTVNFTTAISDANYCALVSMTASSAALTRGSGIVGLLAYNSSTLTTSGFGVYLEDRNGGSSGDPIVVCAAAFR